MLETHWEKNLVINNREYTYSGIFRADELFAAINRALEEKGYTKREKKTEETVTEEGRRSYIELRPYKQKTNYAVLMLKIKISLVGVTEAVQEVQGQKKKVQQGQVHIAFDSWYLTDVEARWGMKPWIFFLKGLVNKFIYRFPLEAGFMNELYSDTAFIYGQVKKLLRSYGGKEEKMVPEEEIRRQIEEEMKKEMDDEIDTEWQEGAK